jgi:phosphoserine phosphatase
MIALLTIDFDETVTVRDTTPCLHELAATRLPPPRADDLRKRWQVGAEAYYADWRLVFHRAICQLKPSSDPRTALSDFTAAFDAVEQNSIESVVAGGFLRGIPRAALRATGATVEKRERVLETLAEVHERGIELHVVSANWSADVVRGGIGELDVPIHSNDLAFDEFDISTGDLKRRIVSALDKLRQFRALPSGEGLRVFVGDSVTDLLALLDADVGILVGANPSPLTVCQRAGVEVVPLTTDATPDRHRLFSAASWEEIARFLFKWA